MSSTDKVFREVLEEVKVSSDELKDIENKTKVISEKISKTAKSLKVKISVNLGGSLAKGTLVQKDKQDIDIFVLFEREEDLFQLPVILRKAGFQFEELKGSRSYYHINEESASGKRLIFEIVPVVRINNPQKANNTTDFSLLHVSYVRKKLSKNKKLADEIILAKSFCRAQECYGAESYINGFSGYVLELLVIKFGSFLNLLKNIDKVRVIDIEKHFKNKEEIMRELNESKLLSPIILIDPTYKYRNAAASLSKSVFEKFVSQAKKFLKKPSSDFFVVSHIDPMKLEKLAKAKKAEIFVLEFSTQKQSGDIAGTKMKKFFEFCSLSFEKKQQKIIAREFIYDGESQEAIGIFVVKEQKIIEIKGPEKKNATAVKMFKKVRKKIYSKGKHVYAKEKVEFKDIIEFLRRHENEMGVSIRVLRAQVK